MSEKLHQEIEGATLPQNESTPAMEDDSDPDIDELDGLEDLAAL